MDERYWDERYAGRDRIFSGEPNGVLVSEIAGMAPGRALDVGCGEGGDALWLARRGWHVTAVDIARNALRRAAAAGADVADRVIWTHADLTATPPPVGAFDLVTAQYFPLPVRPDHAALRGLLDAVAPGGTLLYAGHDPADMSPENRARHRPDDYYHPGGVAELLDGGWTVHVEETRPRTAPPPPGTEHAHDTVLRAERRT